MAIKKDIPGFEGTGDAFNNLVNQGQNIVKKYKSPIEQSEALQKGEQKWKPQKFESLAAFNDALPSPWYKFDDGDYHGFAKVYDTPSEYGINDGRVSKLSLYYKGKPVLNYDRGWDTLDGKFKLDPQHQEFYNKLLSFLDAYGLD